MNRYEYYEKLSVLSNEIFEAEEANLSEYSIEALEKNFRKVFHQGYIKNK